MDRSIEEELSSVIRVWRRLGPAVIAISLGLVVSSWPDRWLAWMVLCLALLFNGAALRQTHMARKALNVVRRGQPENGLVELRKESGDGRDYVKGTVHRETKDTWDVSFAPPSWNVDPVLQKTHQAKVYCEPQIGYPLVVVMVGGHLWAERIPTKVSSSGTERSSRAAGHRAGRT
ncbi:MAG: hypothetical protein IT179_09475 [Acidobacteria bacterium]|nr:hypothetical protein [Acidobacteriota bacterium]